MKLPCPPSRFPLFALVALLLSASEARAEAPAPSASADAVAPPAADARPRKPADPDSPTIIPHNLEGRAACLTCHGPAGRKPFPGDHVGRPSAACLSCHVPSQSSRAQVPNTPTPPTVTNEFCFSCHAKPGLKMTLPGGQDLALFVDKDVYARSMHGRKHMSCTACHPSNQKHPHEPIAGKTARELNRKIVTERCATCHADLFAKYKESVHGKALIEESNLDVPTCTDCHGVHTMRDPDTMLFRIDSPDTCSKCHADASIMKKYGISPDVTKTYLADFHGATVRLGKKGPTPDIAQYKAVCYDCHGIHDIKRASDPTSSVVKQNLVETCRRCHPGADDKFPSAWLAHYQPDRNKWPLVYWVDVFYKLAIPGILGGMGLYIVLEVAHAIVSRIRRRRSA
ncbi:MAG: cytochrome c3 family protein [Byssovorax sp.]